MSATMYLTKQVVAGHFSSCAPSGPDPQAQDRHESRRVEDRENGPDRLPAFADTKYSTWCAMDMAR